MVMYTVRGTNGATGATGSTGSSGSSGDGASGCVPWYPPGPSGEFEVNNQKYRVDPTTYEIHQIIPWAPPVSYSSDRTPITWVFKPLDQI